MSSRSEALATRLTQGAQALAALARDLTDAAWKTPVAKDGRTIGVVVHHVATMYTIEIQLAQLLAVGLPVKGVTWDEVHRLNRTHAKEFAGVSKADAIEVLLRNSARAATAIREMSAEELDRAAPVSLNADAPLTTQFFLEDHAVRHSYHHLAAIKATLKQ